MSNCSQEAVYTLAYFKEFNNWVPVRRVDNPFGGLGFVRLRQAQPDLKIDTSKGGM
jgi:hypothetical protein